jgi:NADH-quinone oxidoreductase subunit L
MQDTIQTCLILIPALPLAAAIVVAALGWKLQEKSHVPVVLALVGSFCASLLLLREVTSLQADTSGAVGYEYVFNLWNWADVHQAYDLPGGDRVAWPEFRIDVALRADALTSMMLCMVTFIATLVTWFASGYMHGDRGYWRFFAYVSIFVFSMTMLVSVSNFVLLFCFWEAVGACSYLLVGYWYEKPAAAAAGKKAFLVNRVGDIGFMLGLFLIWTTYGSLNFHDSLSNGVTDAPAVAEAASAAPASADGAATTAPTLIRGVFGQSRLKAGDYAHGGTALAICLLLLLGACGKSAQFPLHVWLPDAMEGPTPVSALIHAATMVTAGVYMVARCSPLYFASPEAQLVVAGVGGFTALLAGLIALTQFDLKRVLAYSTVSQLGFMFLGLGVGTFAGVTAGMFHLFTHAFFKALLFLGAGSVMHAMGGIIDMRRFGGLKRLMPWTHGTFLVGCLALAGIFPLAGFWSKDNILGALHDKMHAIEHEIAHRHEPRPAADHADDASHPDEAHASLLAGWSQRSLEQANLVYALLYYAALLAAFLTAFYTFRAYAMTFHGEEQIPSEAGHHAHESPPPMTAPLVALAVCSVLMGMIFLNPSNIGQNALVDFIGNAPSLAYSGVQATREATPRFHLDVAGYSTLVALLGVGLALFLYLGERSEVGYLARSMELEGSESIFDFVWLRRLKQARGIRFVDEKLRSVGLGWIVTLLGFVVGLVALIVTVPLMLAHFVTPYKLSQNKFYFDELYNAFIVTPLRWAAVALAWLDRWLVDGIVNLLGWIPPAIGSLMRGLQMGLVQFYALAMVLGMLLLLAARMLYAG